MQELMRNQDRAMSNLESIPGKFNLFKIHWGLVIRTGLSPYNQALADLVIRTAEKFPVRITRSTNKYEPYLEKMLFNSRTKWTTKIPDHSLESLIQADCSSSKYPYPGGTWVLFGVRYIQVCGPCYTDYHGQLVRITRSVRKKSVRITSHTFGVLVIRTVGIRRPQCINICAPSSKCRHLSPVPTLMFSTLITQPK